MPRCDFNQYAQRWNPKSAVISWHEGAYFEMDGHFEVSVLVKNGEVEHRGIDQRTREEFSRKYKQGERFDVRRHDLVLTESEEEVTLEFGGMTDTTRLFIGF